MIRHGPTDSYGLRIGILGVARIAGEAVVLPARRLGHRLVAVASRDRGRAEFFAELCDVERVHDSLQHVLDDPEVDTVYIPQVPALHEQWTLAAIAAGKHVLCEKPLCLSAAQAERIRSAALESGVIVHEAYHHLCHPVWDRIAGVVGNTDVLGDLVAVDVDLAMTAPPRDDPRRSALLGGGALLDLGCYGLQAHHLIGTLAGARSTVTGAEADVLPAPPATDPEEPTDPAGEVDGVVRATLHFDNGATGSVRASIMDAGTRHRLTVVGTRARINVDGFLLPHLGGSLSIEPGGTDESLFVPPSTYTGQLDRFARLVRYGTPMPCGWALSDSIATLSLVDDVRTFSGLPSAPV